MKQKILIVGILLIAGLILASPASAAKVVDKNTHTVYSYKYNCYGSMTYVTYKLSNKHYRTYTTVKYTNGKHGKVQFDITKVSSNKIKITGKVRADWGKSTTSYPVRTSYSVYKYYIKQFKPMLRSLGKV